MNYIYYEILINGRILDGWMDGYVEGWMNG